MCLGVGGGLGFAKCRVDCSADVDWGKRLDGSIGIAPERVWKGIMKIEWVMGG